MNRILFIRSRNWIRFIRSGFKLNWKWFVSLGAGCVWAENDGGQWECSRGKRWRYDAHHSDPGWLAEEGGWWSCLLHQVCPHFTSSFILLFWSNVNSVAIKRYIRNMFHLGCLYAQMCVISPKQTFLTCMRVRWAFTLGLPVWFGSWGSSVSK